MEGLLYKWMGYFAGWNENYFLLRDNQLSEFKSQVNLCNNNFKAGSKRQCQALSIMVR